MDADAHLDALVAPLRADTVSGAAVVARRAAEVMRRAAVRVQAGSIEELRWGLGEVAVKVLDAQPSMAPLVRLLQDVLAAVGDAPTVEEARRSAAHAAESFRLGLDQRAEEVASRAVDVLPANGTIATISSSSTVRATLLQAASAQGPGRATPPPDPSPGHRLRVLCFESRPMEEGRALAESLARAGVPVTFAVDAAMHSLVAECAAVLMGADSIGDLGVVNKIGSASLAQAATSAGVPTYVLCDGTKVLPPGFPQVVEDDRPANEVWKAPAGVSVWNRYFEVVPLVSVTGIVTDHAVLSPEELERERSEMDFPDFLRRWAESR